MSLSRVVILLLGLLAVVRACDVSLNTDNKGHNPACTAPSAPYCVAGACVQCNPYLEMDQTICDCPNGRVCNRNLNEGTAGMCVTPPKYGSSCTGNSGCLTVNQYNYATQLVCVSGSCRQCDTSAASSIQCGTNSSRSGTTLFCNAPGQWSNQAVTTQPPSSTTASPSPSGTTTSNGHSTMG